MDVLIYYYNEDISLSAGAALRQERSPRRRARRVGDPSPYNPFKNYNPF